MGASSPTVIPNLSYFQAASLSGVTMNAINFQANAAGQTGFAIDNIAVSAVPEPSALALLGAAALIPAAFLFRRRASF